MFKSGKENPNVVSQFSECFREIQSSPSLPSLFAVISCTFKPFARKLCQGNTLILKLPFLHFQNDELIEIFGSNKKKRAMHSRLRNKVSDDSIQKTATHAAETAKDLPLPTDGICLYLSLQKPFKQ